MEKVFNGKVQKILINIGCAFSFVLAYLVYGFGFLATKNILYIIGSFVMIGLLFYGVFEVISSCLFTLYMRFVPNFPFSQAGYRYSLRLMVIARNILLCLINIIFIFFPVASIWGIKLSHVLFTIAMVVVGVYFVREHIKDCKYQFLLITATATFVYLLAFLFIGVIS